MATVKEVYKNQLDMASVRLVKDKPLMSKTSGIRPYIKLLKWSLFGFQKPITFR